MSRRVRVEGSAVSYSQSANCDNGKAPELLAELFLVALSDDSEKPGMVDKRL
jgi:hypothetical protein